MSRYLTARALAKTYGFSPRYWTRLAAQGKVPGAYQPAGPAVAAFVVFLWRWRESK